MNCPNFKKLFVVSILVSMSACSSSAKRVIFDENNPTMESILQGGVNDSLIFTDKAHGRGESGEGKGSDNSEHSVFRELDNPTLFLYIEPHVTKGGTYIPGMTVPYKQHNKVEFALPGEL